MFSRRVDPAEFQRCCDVLGVGSEVTLDRLEKAHLRQSFLVIKSGSAEERAALRNAYESLAAHLKSRPLAAGVEESSPPAFIHVAPPAAHAPIYVPPQRQDAFDAWNPFSFESWPVNLIAPPLVVALAWLMNASPLGFFLRGFHVWMHEFGHATVAWMVGKRALPLPIGWTNVEQEKAMFVYFGILFLLGLLFWAGLKERRVMPMLLAVMIAAVQAYMTFKLPEDRETLWLAFGGVGGEFYLSAAIMGLFFFRMPEKFKWGACRYVCLFLGASCFLNILTFWRKIRRGEEGIPYGSMIHGDEDSSGDMNILHEDYSWTQREIIHTYNDLGTWCVVALVVVYLVFALRIDRLIAARLPA